MRIRHIIIDLNKENEDLQAWVVLGTLLEHIIEHKGKIKYAVAKIDDCEKMTKTLLDEKTEFWMSVVQDEQL